MSFIKSASHFHDLICSNLLKEVTEILTKRNAIFSLNLSFYNNSRHFTFSASSSKNHRDVPVSQEKRKKNSPSQKEGNWKRLVEYKDRLQMKLETSTSPDKSFYANLTNKVDSMAPSVSCDECGHTIKTKNGMKLHKIINMRFIGLMGTLQFLKSQLKKNFLLKLCAKI